MAPSQRSQPGDVLWVGGMIRQALARHGLASHLEQADDLETAAVVDAHGTEWLLANLIQRLRLQQERDDWPQAVTDHVESMLTTSDHPAPETLAPDELRPLLRSRLVAEVAGDPSDLSYGRRFAPGVLEVLCLNYPESVLTMPRELVEQLAIGLDEAFAQGRANTDAEPVEERFHVDDSVWGLTGDSMFIASRVTNMARLIADVIGPAPLGVSFAIPNRSLVIYTVMTEEGWRQEATDLIQVLETILTDDDFYHPGGLVSSDIFYWSPEGRIEPLGGPEIGAEGERTLHIRPSDGFLRRLGSRGES